ncbi:STAT5B [Acanthosepion pharaonis]|uniref:STAT5B n=1 Tax=Acanthosepion pharaonis TaxID=158019 RepID=A0A812D1Q6_ACAPH|nr:STAT5B [Sepia pharaonis]
MNKLSSFLNELNIELIQRTFIVLVQPPRILKVNTNMKASVCLLPAEALNITSKSVTVTADLTSNDTVKGILQNNTSTMKISQKQNTAEFTKMKVNDVTRSKNKSGESVTDEKFELRFFMQIEIEGIKLNLQVCSFPVVVIQNGNQECKAMATILWDNFFDENTVPWPKFADMLKYRFKETIGVSLTPQDFKYFASKIFDKTVNDLSTMSITWTQFCKVNMNDKKFSFWDWFYAIERLIQNCFLDMYKDKLVIGFVSKKQTEDMLNPTHPGTFLLRFSNNCLGGISIAVKGSKSIKHLSPFKIEELKNHSLVKLIQKQKKFLYLYPNRPKSEAFQNYSITKEDPDETLKNKGYEERDFNLSYESDADDEQTNSNALMNINHDVMDFETSVFNCSDFLLPPLPEELPADIFNE